MKQRGLWTSGDEICFETHLTPRASRSEILDWDEAGRLRVRVSSPPVDGAANTDLRETIAAALGIPMRQVRVVRGETSRQKCIAVKGISIDHLEKTLGRPAASTGRSPTSSRRSNPERN